MAPEPPRADFALFIDFDKGSERPERVFQAADELIRSFQRLDRTLAGAIDSSIEPVLVLEDIEAGSLKIWLRDKLEHIEDQALYELDWKPTVGKYLLAAKYAFIEWVNDDAERKRPGSLADLRRKLVDLASRTDVRKIPTYGPPSATELLGSAEDLGRALSKLGEQDTAKFISDMGDQEFDLRLTWDALEISDLAVKESLTAPPAPMILAVKRPDYLGAAQWEFRHGKRTIRAKIEHADWLAEFQARKVDVRPGDALKCLVSVEVNYGFDNEVISEVHTVTEVMGVLENEYRQGDMFGED